MPEPDLLSDTIQQPRRLGSEVCRLMNGVSPRDRPDHTAQFLQLRQITVDGRFDSLRGYPDCEAVSVVVIGHHVRTALLVAGR